MLQLISGVPKLRAAGAECRAFARWADPFAEQRQVAYKARRVAAGVAVFLDGVQVTGTYTAVQPASANLNNSQANAWKLAAVAAGAHTINIKHTTNAGQTATWLNRSTKATLLT